MRIGLVIYGALDTVSGGYLYDRMLVEFLRAAGDVVQIVSLPWRDYAQHLADNGSDAISAQLRALDVDVLLQDELNHPSLIAANRMMRGRVPIISIVHHLRVNERHAVAMQRTHALVERAYLRSCDAFVFNSQTTRASVDALLGESKPHVVAYPAGDRFDASLPLCAGLAQPPRALFVGNVIERKGLHTVIDALPGCDWQLLIAGRDDVEPAYSAQLRSRIGALGLQTRVRWLGRLSDDALAAVYAECSALVMPSHYEGFGIVYLEAMRFGLPVIASTAGAADEIVTDGIEGFLVPPDQSAAIVKALHALRDTHTHKRMSVAAQARFARHPRWAESCAAIRAFLKTYEHP